MKTEGSLSFLQEHITDARLEPDESSQSVWSVLILSFSLCLGLLFSSNFQSGPVILIEFSVCFRAEPK
jgi:hypothetical protein